MGCGGDDAGTAGSGGSSGSTGIGGKDASAGGATGGATTGTGGVPGTSGGSAEASDDAGDASVDGAEDTSADVDRSDEVSGDAVRSEDVSADVEASEVDAQDETFADVQDAAFHDDESVEASLQDADAAAARPKICAEHCTADEDCARDTGIQKFRCHPTTHHCATCIDDWICIATRSLWTGKTCTEDSACVNEGGFAPFGDVCIDVDGTGYCAFLATSTSNCASFLNTTNFSTFHAKKYGSDDAVDVCGKPSRCDADRGSCQNPCTSNTSCTPARGGKTCNTGLGRCECASDGDCGPGAPTCNSTLKQCECGSQADCSADTGRTLTCQ
jgi:hypothetical protein